MAGLAQIAAQFQLATIFTAGSWLSVLRLKLRLIFSLIVRYLELESFVNLYTIHI